MKHAELLLAAMFCAASLPAQQPQPAGGEKSLDRIVAVVGGTPILWSDVQEVILQRQASGASFPDDSAGQLAVIKQIVSDLVDEELLVERASSDTSITVADSDLANTVEQQVKQIRSQMSSDQEFLNALRGSGFGSEEEYRRWLTEQARRRELQQRYVARLQRDGKMINVAVSDADVTDAYQSMKAKGTLPKRPPSVTFKQIVIPTTASPAARAVARARAESLLVLIRHGADFEQLAKRESMDSVTREQGGDLGWNRREAMVPAFANVMFSLPPGQVGPVTETQYGFHIIKVDRAKPTEVKARHILIRPTIDSSDIARAGALADSVLALWKAGVPYDTLFRKFHDHDETEGSLDPFPIDKLPESYRTAFDGIHNGDFVRPFAINDPQRGVPKFVIAQLIDVSQAGDYTLPDLRDQIRQQLQNERSYRRLIDTLKQETFVSINIEGAAGIKAPPAKGRPPR